MNNQILDMMLDIQDKLVYRKFPVDFVYGPERLQRPGYFGGVVILERDREGEDQWLPAKGASTNPDSRGVRGLAVKFTIFSRSALPSAAVFDHEFECEQYVDALLSALAEWVVAAKAGVLQIASSRYLSSKDRDDVEAWGGVVYQVKAVIQRGVFSRDFTGAARPTGQAGGVGGAVNVAQNSTDTPVRVPLP